KVGRSSNEPSTQSVVKSTFEKAFSSPTRVCHTPWKLTKVKRKSSFGLGKNA
ncbi:MAG: hypothetical protein LQ341_004104, partial [Variospora aurantia]